MTVAHIVTSVLFANGLTISMIYALWRLRRDEGDLKAIGLFLFCCLVAGLMAWPVAQRSDRQEAPHSSAVQPLAQR